MKGKSRLGVQNEITDYFLSLEFPQITFLESKRMETMYGEWEEIYILMQTKKVETPGYFRYITFQLDFIMKALRKFGVSDCGIQEFDCGDNTYNILIYVLNNGKDKKDNEEEDYGTLCE